MKSCSLPPLAYRLLEFFLPASTREAVLGDLLEEYALRVESTSALAASRWFWGQACRSVPYMLWSSLWSANCLTSVSIAAGVYIFMGMLKFAADLTISRWLAPSQTIRVVLAPIVFLTITAIGGCVAARIRRGATIFLAFIVMITVIVLIGIRVCTIPVPWWYQFVFLTLGPLAVLITPVVLSTHKSGSARPFA
jgi:hypothetical protein